MMKRLLSRNFMVAILCWLGLFVFLFATNPSKIPISFIILPFGLLMASLWYSWSFICDQLFSSKTSQFGSTMRNFGHMLAVSITVCMALQSIGQLSIRDVAAVIAVSVLGFFYVNRTLGAKRGSTG